MNNDVRTNEPSGVAGVEDILSTLIFNLFYIVTIQIDKNEE